MFCAHLSWSDDHSAIRQEQVAEICRFVRETRPAPVPGGALRRPQRRPARATRSACSPAAPRHRCPRVVFRDAWEAAGNSEPGYTWSNANPFAAASLDLDRRIDHVMVGTRSSAASATCCSAQLAGDVPIDGMWGSDHLAVVAELRY